MKYVFTFLAVAFAMSANAQTSKGSWMIGGAMKIQRQSSDYAYFDQSTGAVQYAKANYGVFELSPTVGYFLNDRIMLGLHVDDYRSWRAGGPTDKRHIFSFGPIARYYIPVARTLAVFPEIAYLYSSDTHTFFIDTSNQTQKAKSSVIRGGLGLAWFVTPNIGIEGLLAYQKTDSKNKDLGDQQDLYYSIGIQFYLPKKN